MMLTEDEARQKWCPMAYAPVITAMVAIAQGANLEVEPKKMGRCIASDCMAWREGPRHDTRDHELWSKSKGKKVVSARNSDAEWKLKNPNEPLPPKLGYCGLAGRPE